LLRCMSQEGHKGQLGDNKVAKCRQDVRIAASRQIIYRLPLQALVVDVARHRLPHCEVHDLAAIRRCDHRPCLGFSLLERQNVFAIGRGCIIRPT
jgi:hypothetical protein